MSHPIASQRRALIIYSLIWLLVIVVDYFILDLRQELPAIIAIADAAITGLALGLLGLLVWYPTRYIPFQKHNPFYSISAHAAAGVSVILVWLLVSVGLLSVIFSSNEEFRIFLSGSVYWRALLGVMIYLVLVLIYYLILYNRSLRERAQAEERLKTLVKESELNMLKSQINPHFLFNSLNSISSLTMSNPDEAREMIIRLSDFLRYSLKHRENEFVTLNEEIGRMRDYLAIEQIRFGEKLQYNFELEEHCGEMLVPTMILQPLIENAIKYGVYESLEPVSVDLHCRTLNNHLAIVLGNDFDPEQPKRKGTGLGLQNVSQRIQLAYDLKGSVEWSVRGTRFEVKLMIPI